VRPGDSRRNRWAPSPIRGRPPRPPASGPVAVTVAVKVAVRGVGASWSRLGRGIARLGIRLDGWARFRENRVLGRDRLPEGSAAIAGGRVDSPRGGGTGVDFLSSVFAWLSEREAGISAVVGIAVLAGIVCLVLEVSPAQRVRFSVLL
jgi:hypothetical protein